MLKIDPVIYNVKYWLINKSAPNSFFGHFLVLQAFFPDCFQNPGSLSLFNKSVGYNYSLFTCMLSLPNRRVASCPRVKPCTMIENRTTI